jgi:hypothetical protein
MPVIVQTVRRLTLIRYLIISTWSAFNILRRSFALRSFYGPLKLRDELLAQEWRRTLTVGWVRIPRCALTRFLRHWFPSPGLLACPAIALNNGRPVSMRLHSISAVLTETVT